MPNLWPFPKLNPTKLSLRAYGVAYFLGESIGLSRDTTPMRTVFNPKTRQHEQISLTQFQQLSRQGKIEESVSQSPYDGRPQRTYRMI
jgi:hypothetical protein